MSRTRLVAGLLGGVVAVVALGAGPAWAYFGDVAAVSSPASTAHVVERPDSVSCSAALLAVTVSWPAKSALYEYEVVLRRVATGAVVSSQVVTGTSKTYSGLLDFGLTSSSGTVDFVVEVRSRLKVAPTWVSVDVRSTPVRVFAVAIGATVSCGP